MNDELKTIAGYLKSQWPALAVLGIAAAIFSALNVLSRDGSVDVYYGIFLLVVLALCVLLANYLVYRQRVKKLMRGERNVSLDFSDLPKPYDAQSQQYTAIIDKLHRKMTETVSKIQEDYTEQLDYYSMWIHQIKTSISAMRLIIQADQTLTDKMAWEAEIFKIEQYASMVLWYVRLSDLAEDMIFETVPLHPLVCASVKKYSTIFIHKHLAVDIEDFDISAVSDAKWLAVIFEQFLSNSLKYSSKGTIRIKCRRVNGTEAELIIRDEGIGIRAEDIPRIFDKGYTGYNGRIYEKSTGIGLYMAKKAADHLGVRLEVTSLYGKWTEAAIYCPAVREKSFLSDINVRNGKEM